MADSAVYDESKITTLSSIEHIRLRTGMYIGRLGNGSNYNDGVYILLKEVIDNGVDEYIMGKGKRLEIDLAGTHVRVRDYGRGIPFGKLIDCVSRINTGAKYNDDVFQFSVGLNGVGTKAVNALSSCFKVTSFREGRFKRVTFMSGVLQSDEDGSSDEKTGTLVEFVPDREIFDEYSFNNDFISKRLWNYVYLNSGLNIYFNGERFYSKNGLLDLICDEMGDDTALYDSIYYKDKVLEFACTHCLAFGENFFSFVNGQYTNNGGTHESAFKEGVLKGINDYCKRGFQGIDIRDGIVAAISIRIKDPVFESQTKNKLSNTDIKGWIVSSVRNGVSDFLHKNPETAKKLLDKISLNEKLRKELQSVKQKARERAKKVAIKIPKLKDCKQHLTDNSLLGDESMIFITEGQSASGSIVTSRNVQTQAIFSLKGKPLNCYGMKRDLVYKNEEMYNVMTALGLEDGIEGLRYNKIVLATDSDVDGLHIRNLLITFFLYFFESTITKGHLYILETPLFRVRNKKKTIYAYTEEQKKEAIQTIGTKDLEITRFKGLGEISPKEFGQFIGQDIKLIPVRIEHLSEVPKLLSFYMGKNTPARKQYIMDNLI